MEPRNTVNDNTSTNVPNDLDNEKGDKRTSYSNSSSPKVEGTEAGNESTSKQATSPSSLPPPPPPVPAARSFASIVAKPDQREGETANNAVSPTQQAANQDGKAGRQAGSNDNNVNSSSSAAAAAAAATTTSATSVADTETGQAETPTSKTHDNGVNKEESIKDIVIHFEYLLEKSQQQFVGLRDLPPIGGRQWITYFQRTFEIYTRLWKFQQQNRAILEKPETYGLKRREIGEIASKIGQLYYHYYLRTSETNYLQEAYTFYGAIRDRSYLKDDPENRNPALYIKKMRYYARFIVVCLLLNKEGMVQDLLDELQEIVQSYLGEFNPVDEKEWKLVLKEIKMFLQAERKPIPIDEEGNPYHIVHRLPFNSPSIKDIDCPKIRLQDAIIIGSQKDQVKFSELTLDMYRMLHSLEREPNLNKDPLPKDKDKDKDDGNAPVQPPQASPSANNSNAGNNTNNSNNSNTDQPSAAPASEKVERDKDSKPATTKRPNPHKYLLYQPTYGQTIVFLANVFKEVGEQGCALLYISGDGYSESSSASGNSKSPNSVSFNDHGFTGGIVSTSHKPAETEGSSGRVPITNCIHPADLLPFTRKALFVIVESHVSSNFKNFPVVFGQPLLFLLSPTEYPSDCDVSRTGGYYTLFLNSTLMAFCTVSKLHQLAREKWTGLAEQMQDLESHVMKLLNEKLADTKYKAIRRFLWDDFLVRFLVRHVIACGVFYLHNGYTKENGGLPASSPELPESLCYNPSTLEKIYRIAQFMGVADLYTPYEPPRAETPEVKEEAEKVEDEHQAGSTPTGTAEEEEPAAAQVEAEVATPRQDDLAGGNAENSAPDPNAMEINNNAPH